MSKSHSISFGGVSSSSRQHGKASRIGAGQA